MRPEAEFRRLKRNNDFRSHHAELNKHPEPPRRDSHHQYHPRGSDVKGVPGEPSFGRHPVSIPPSRNEQELRGRRPELAASPPGLSNSRPSTADSSSSFYSESTTTDETSSSTSTSNPEHSNHRLPFEQYVKKATVDLDPFTSDEIQFRSFKRTAKMFDKSLDELQNEEEDEGHYEEEEELPKQRMELYCEVCNVSVSNMKGLQDHFAGAKHQKELRKSGLSSDFSEIGKDKYVDRDPTLKTKILSCKLCDIAFSGSDMAVHVNNPAHLDALSDFEQPPPKDDPFWFVEVGKTESKKANEPERTADGYHCELCGCTVPHYELFQVHLKGKSHQKRLKWSEGQKKMPEGMEQHWCSVCNIFCTNREALANHLVGKKHAKTLRQRGVTSTEDGKQYQGPPPSPPRSSTSLTSSSRKPSRTHRNPSPGSLRSPYASIDRNNQRVRCSLCHIMLYSNVEVHDHLASEEHIRKIRFNPNLKLQDFLIPADKTHPHDY